MADYTILPCIFTTMESDEISNKKEILEKGIAVPSSNEIRHILEMSKHARPHREILDYVISLTTKIVTS